MGWDLMTAGMWVGVGNSILAGTVLLMGRGAFTRSPAVLAASQTLLPCLCVALLVHTCSMASEGMLLAGVWVSKDGSHSESFRFFVVARCRSPQCLV
jgi:hypothetical protein